jgi:hypothetical protein
MKLHTKDLNMINLKNECAYSSRGHKKEKKKCENRLSLKDKQTAESEEMKQM